MIRFKIYDQGKEVADMPLNGSYLFAQDEIPVRGRLEFADGELLGIRHSDSAIGLASLWNVPEFGKVFLQTTRLPERDKAYNLNVEIARGRLLRLNQKREEWGMVDLQLTEEHHKLIDGAMDNFVLALCNAEKPGQAALYADRSLKLAMDAGEAMAAAHAEMFLARRSSTQGFGRHSFGCCFNPSRIKDKEYLKLIKSNFHFVTIPVSWRQIQPEEQRQDFELLDECVEWLSHNRIAIKVGPLISFSPNMVPDWLYIWENDFEQLREMAYEYVTSVVERYGNKVQAWDVVSGLNADNCFRFSFDQIIEMTRSACLAAKRAFQRCLVLVELTEPWGEYYAVNQRTVPPMIYADMVVQSGVNFDGYGLKIRFGRGGAGMWSRDLLELSGLLDRFAAFGKQVHLSGVQVPSRPDPRDNVGKIGDPGFWHEPWSEEIQARWLDSVYRIALSKPYVETVTWQDFADCEDGILMSGGLVNSDLTPKAVYETFGGLKKNLVKPTKK